MTVTPFFIPGATGPLRATETTYLEMRRHLEVQMGRPPRASRILELWTRRGRVDCITRVGAPDPISGETVLAIFGMGSRQPFVVWRQHGDGTPDSSVEVLGCSAYSVLEFDS